MPPTRTFKQIQLYLFRKWTWLKELLQSSSSDRNLNIFYIDALEQRSSCLLRTSLNHSVYAILKSALNVSNTVTLVYSFHLENKTPPSSSSDRLPLPISPSTEQNRHSVDISTHSNTNPTHHNSHPQADHNANNSFVEDSLMVALNSPSELALTMISPQDKGDSRKRKLVSGGVADKKHQSPSPHHGRSSPRSLAKKRGSPGRGADSSRDVKNVMSKEDSLFILLDDFLDTQCDVSHIETSTHSPGLSPPLMQSNNVLPLLKSKAKSKKRKGKGKSNSAASCMTTTNTVRTLESEPNSSTVVQKRRNPRNLRRIRPTFLAPLSAHDDFMATFKKLSSFSKLP